MLDRLHLPARTISQPDLLFDREFLAKLEYLHIMSKRAFAGRLKADRRSRRQGSGLEFADHRAYAVGDDFRYIDWRAYQRLDKLFLRLFEEKQDLPIYLFIDSSRSMSYGIPSKFHHARQIAAALCYIGLAHLDRVTLVSYSDRIQRELSPQRGRSRIFNVFRFLTSLDAAGETDARQAFATFSARKRSPGLAVIISDFLDAAGFEGGLNVLRNARHDVVVVHVTSKADANPDLKGDVVLVDSEAGATQDLSVTPARLVAYRRQFDRFCQQIAGYCSKYRFGYLRTITEVPFEDAILQVFRQGRFLA